MRSSVRERVAIRTSREHLGSYGNTRNPKRTLQYWLYPGYSF